MAAPKAKPGATIVFGMGGGGDADAGDEHAEATDALKAALEDSGMEADAADNVVAAMRNYVEACIHAPPPKDEEEY